MQVQYTYDTAPALLKLWKDRQHSRIDFDREEATAIAEGIAERGGYARVIFGGNILSAHGTDPRHQ